MATFDCEVLGYVQYNPELSYAELIECEDELKEQLTDLGSFQKLKSERQDGEKIKYFENILKKFEGIS